MFKVHVSSLVVSICRISAVLSNSVYIDDGCMLYDGEKLFGEGTMWLHVCFGDGTNENRYPLFVIILSRNVFMCRSESALCSVSNGRIDGTPETIFFFW